MRPAGIISAADYARWLAQRGAKARNKAMTPEARSEAARKAVTARWLATTKEERRAAARKAALARWAKAKKRIR
jgi:hypothetical protein